MFVILQSQRSKMVNINLIKVVELIPSALRTESGNVEVFSVCAEIVNGERIILGTYKTSDKASMVTGQMLACKDDVFAMPDINFDEEEKNEENKAETKKDGEV